MIDRQVSSLHPVPTSDRTLRVLFPNVREMSEAFCPGLRFYGRVSQWEEDGWTTWKALKD